MWFLLYFLTLIFLPFFLNILFKTVDDSQFSAVVNAAIAQTYQFHIWLSKVLFSAQIDVFFAFSFWILDNDFTMISLIGSKQEHVFIMTLKK